MTVRGVGGVYRCDGWGVLKRSPKGRDSPRLGWGELCLHVGATTKNKI